MLDSADSAAAIWLDAGPSESYAAGSVRMFRANGLRFAIGRTAAGDLFALDDACPHEGYPLSRGALTDCALTCPWHNFKFDVRDGACLRGDEAVDAHTVRERDGRVELLPTELDRDAAIGRRWDSLGVAVLDGRPGQMARDTVRLLAFGVPAAEIAGFAARLDALHSDEGTTHVLAVAADLLTVLPDFAGLAAARPLQLALEQCADSNVRRPLRPRAAPSAVNGDVDASYARLAAAVEAEDVVLSEGLVRGAVAAGWGRDVLETWFFRLCSEHFLGFGHPLIYSAKAFDLLDAIGWAHADLLLGALVVNIIVSRRDDVLPNWQQMRNNLAERVAHLPRWNEACRASAAANPSADNVDLAVVLQRQLVAGDTVGAFDALTDALQDSLPLDAVCDALVVAAAYRMLAYDLAIETRDDVQDNWLSITHTLTFASAVRTALRRTEHPDVLRLLWQAIRLIGGAAALDSETAHLEPVVTKPVAELRAGWLERCIGERDFARPIVLTHLFKTALVACEEHNRMLGRCSDEWALRPLLAAQRLMDGPVRQRRTTRLCHEAVRLVRDGKVPRVLA